VVGVALFAGLFLLLSGALLVALPAETGLTQTLRAMHVLAGLVLLVPMVLGTISHARIRLALRSGSTTWSERLTSLSLLLVIGTGLLLLQGAWQWSDLLPRIGSVHLAASIALVLLTLLHVRSAMRRRAGRRGTGLRARAIWSHVGAVLVVLGVVVAIGQHLETARSPPPTASPPQEGLSPFLPARTVTPNHQLVDATRLAGSEDCGVCHETIYRQWSESMHRASAIDPHVETGSHWFSRENGVEAGRFCAGCHDPIPLLAGEFTREVRGDAGPAAGHPEGVSCVICHAIDKVAREHPGNGSFRVNPPSPPLFGMGPAGKAMLRMSGTSHSEAFMKRPLFQESVFCATCHQQIAFGAELPPSDDQLSHPYSQWQATRFADAGSDDFKSCQDCHMKLVDGEDPAAVDGQIHSHRFVGGNHAHAVSAGFSQQADLTLENLRDGLEMDLRVAPKQDKAGVLRVEVAVTNAEIGHDFPSGTIDLFEAWVELVAEVGGERLLGSGLLDERHYLDEDAHVWRKVLVDHRNLPIDLHNLAVVKGVRLKRTIKALETDIARYDIPLGALASGEVQIRARLRMRRANQRWNDWLFNFDGRTVPVVDIFSLSREQDLEEVHWVDMGAVTAGESAGVETASTVASVPEGMVYIPAGPSLLGDPQGEPDEQPATTVQVSAFAIDRHPVTNAGYQQFLRFVGQDGPTLKLPWAEKYNWRGDQFPAGAGDRPAVLVTRDEAVAYCAWRDGMRLPSEPEWEKAARGPGGFPYPWGNDWQVGDCPDVAGMDVPERVGMCPQRASPYGVEDLLGGVFEWTADSYSAYDRTFLHPNANEWLVTFDPLMYAVRGSPPGQEGPATAAFSRAGQNSFQRGRVGFRCVMSLAM
jgi:formylglycine-generating enzyme required for sulfatase activity